MKRTDETTKKSSRRLATILAIAALTAVACSSGTNSTTSTSTDSYYRGTGSEIVPAVTTGGDFFQLASASYDAWAYSNYDRAEKMALQVSAETEAGPAARVEAEKTLTLVYLSKGDESSARSCIERMLELDELARFSPEHRYPPVVFDIYHEVKDALPAGTMDIRTIAIGDFENNSIYVKKNDKYNFDNFRPALVHAIVTDLSMSTGLKIVDRQRTEKIIEETRLVETGLVDPQQAVRAGKLLGAHCFVFGQYMILDKKKVRIDMRVVHTATGEIIVAKQVTGEYKGKPEKFLAIEQELVTEIAAAVDQLVSASTGGASNFKQTANDYFLTRKDEVKGRKNYAEAQFLTGEAVSHEEQENYNAAIASWNDVLKVDPANEVAKERLLVLSQAG